MGENAGLRPRWEATSFNEVHGSRSVAGGGDVGTERTEHEQRSAI